MANKKDAKALADLMKAIKESGAEVIGIPPGGSLTIGLFDSGNSDGKEIPYKEVMATLKSKAVTELAGIFKGIFDLWPNAVFEDIQMPMEMVFQDGWKIGDYGSSNFPEDRKDEEEAYTKVYKAFAEAFAICPSTICPSSLEADAARFLDNLFVVDATMGINLGTTLGEVNDTLRRGKEPICPSFIEYASRTLG